MVSFSPSHSADRDLGFLSDEFSMQRPVEFGHLANDLFWNLVVDVDRLIQMFSSVPPDPLQIRLFQGIVPM